jgi:hypothetical protein
MRLDLATALGDVHRQTGHLASARVLYDEAIALAEVTDERGRLAELLTSAAQVHQGLHEMSEALGEGVLGVALRQAGGRGGGGRRSRGPVVGPARMEGGAFQRRPPEGATILHRMWLICTLFFLKLPMRGPFEGLLAC